jgi:endonuclease YncB( thermonuclease family)
MRPNYGRYRRRWRGPPRAPRSFASRLGDICLTLIFFGLVALLVARLNQRPPVEPLVGKAYVIDGDTISVGQDHIRFKGIDAPEIAQSCGKPPYACGQEARQSLIKLIDGRQVRCKGEGRDKYERTLATCFVGETNLNRSLVESGQAVSYGDYRDAELAARGKKLGIWKGGFETPQDWRREQEQLHEASQPELEHARTPSLMDRFNEWFNRLMGEMR